MKMCTFSKYIFGEYVFVEAQRKHPAPGGKKYSCAPTNKTTESEVKIGAKVRKNHK